MLIARRCNQSEAATTLLENKAITPSRHGKNCGLKPPAGTTACKTDKQHAKKAQLKHPDVKAVKHLQTLP